MKYIITESQYKSIINENSSFEKESKIISLLLSKTKYNGVCEYQFYPDKEHTRVVKVEVNLSTSWWRKVDDEEFYRLPNTILNIKENLKKYLGLDNIIVDYDLSGTCSGDNI